MIGSRTSTGKSRLSETKRDPLARGWRLQGRKNVVITNDHKIYSSKWITRRRGTLKDIKGEGELPINVEK